MYDKQYEEYIRSVLGYPSTRDINQNYIRQNQMYQTEYPNPSQTRMKSDLEECYPEIYKIIYPMVQKACDRNINANSREEIEQMTDEIYSALEDSNQINVNINLGNTVSTTNANRTQNRNEVHKEEVQRKTLENQETENRNVEMQNRRRPGNNNLRDLIKILLIRELLRRRNRPHNNFPPRPPQNSPRPPMRPPIMPRNYEQPLYDIYEY